VKLFKSSEELFTPTNDKMKLMDLTLENLTGSCDLYFLVYSPAERKVVNNLLFFKWYLLTYSFQPRPLKGVFLNIISRIN